MKPSTDDFRRVMGLFATGVTVVTAAHGDVRRAMTANSVTSVSLDPMSLLVCVNHEALTHGVLSAAGAFCVNILSDQQEALSRGCARPDSPEATLDGVEFRPGVTGSPVIAGVLAHLDCRVAATFEFGTHTIFVGEVVDVLAADGRPLVFHRGRYVSLVDPTG